LGNVVSTCKKCTGGKPKRLVNDRVGALRLRRIFFGKNSCRAGHALARSISSEQLDHQPNEERAP
jgi:hypothetical protein